MSLWRRLTFVYSELLRRYVTAALALAELLVVQGLAIWAYLRVPRVRRSGVLQICAITVLLVRVSRVPF